MHPKGGHRSDGHHDYHSVQDFKIRIRYDANADKGDELYDKCGQLRLPDSTLAYARVLTISK